MMVERTAPEAVEMALMVTIASSVLLVLTHTSTDVSVSHPRVLFFSQGCNVTVCFVSSFVDKKTKTREGLMNQQLSAGGRGPEF